MDPRYWLLIRGTTYVLIDTDDAGAGRQTRRRVRDAVLGLFQWMAAPHSSWPYEPTAPWADAYFGTHPGTLRATTDADLEAIDRARAATRIRHPA